MKKYAVDGLDGYPNELAHKLDDALELNAELLDALRDAVDYVYSVYGSNMTLAANDTKAWRIIIAKVEGDA